MLILIFILILSLLILIHELGHFLAAKQVGVTVEEFGIGYPPRAVKLFIDKQGTIYSLNWLPFGGFVRLAGQEQPDQSETSTQGKFYAQSKKSRFFIISAGVVANFLFGVLAFGAIYTKIGIPELIGAVLIEEVAENSPAQTAGLMPGDKIIGVHNHDFSQETRDYVAFTTVLSQHQGETVWLSFSPETAKYDTPVYIRLPDEIPEGEGAIGVTIRDTEFVHYPVWQMPFRGIWVGLKAAVSFGVFLIGAIALMFKDLFVSGVVPEGVSGPVGIGHAVVQQKLLTPDLISVTNFNFAAVLSINLAIVNLLPLPALDGGWAALVMLESLLRRRLKPVIERWFNLIGMGFLLFLIVAITYRDIRQIVLETGLLQPLLETLSPYLTR